VRVRHPAAPCVYRHHVLLLLLVVVVVDNNNNSSSNNNNNDNNDDNKGRGTTQQQQQQPQRGSCPWWEGAETEVEKKKNTVVPNGSGLPFWAYSFFFFPARTRPFIYTFGRAGQFRCRKSAPASLRLCRAAAAANTTKHEHTSKQT
jgi:hypothetical protein